MDTKTFLVVDDSKLIHKMFNVLLRHHVVIHAMDGQEGLEKLGENPNVDIVLLDINMPRMNGLEFLQKVRGDSAWQKLPVVIISTEGKEEDTHRALEAGASAYIKKPFDHKQLQDIIAQF